MIYLHSGDVYIPEGAKVRIVSPEKSKRVLADKNAKAGVPTSSLPRKVQEKLERGEQITEEEMVPIPIPSCGQEFDCKG